MNVSKLYDDYENYTALCEKLGIMRIAFYSHWYSHYCKLKEEHEVL